MRRLFGIPAVAAADHLQWEQVRLARQAVEPLPEPTGKEPYRLGLASVLGSEPDALSLFVIGDHGGVKDPAPQAAVADAMVAAHAQRPVTAVYSVGDVVYFNGAECEYPAQFGEPYAHLNVPFFAIPGNHDGDPGEADEPSLAGFMRHFCDSEPHLLPDMAEYQRTTMDQPNCFWTLASKHATIIGLYSNVPSGGVIGPEQARWLVAELQAAPAGVPLVVSLHHPPFSVDAHHGGSAAMGRVLDAAFESAARLPDLVLSGHVHDMQVFTRKFGGKDVRYVVAGNGGYHNLHSFAKGATEGEELAPGVTFDYGDAARWGFVRLTFGVSSIDCEYTAVDRLGNATSAYTFSAAVG